MRLTREGRTTDGWTLNISRGGVRVIVEDPVGVGSVYEVSIGDVEQSAARTGRVVWVQDEADGQICGIAFLDSDEGAPPQTTASDLPDRER